MSSRVRSPIESRWRRGGRSGGRISVATRSSGIVPLLHEQHTVDLVDLDELDGDPLVACGGQVLADVVGSDRQLAVAAVGEDGELDARGPSEVEERVDRRADRAAGVEHVVDED